MKQEILFGEWKPDLPPYASQALDTATNVYPVPNGYRPIKAVSAITEALDGFNGGAAYVGSDGTAALLAGTGDGLYRYSSGWTSEYSVDTLGRWRFAQFGDNVIAVHGGAPVKFDLIGGTGGALGGSPPNASLVATVRDFVFVAGDPSNILTVTWSAFNNSEEWTIGTDQCDDQIMPEGGEITGLAGGEYGIILQRNRVTRATYVGGDVIFQFDEIGSNVGCIAKGSVAQAGRLVFFLSERGFMKCDGTDVYPIGNERVDRTFFSFYPRSDLDNMYAAIDPRNFLVVWAMPGNPGRLWIYNWALDRWSLGVLPVNGLFSGFTANVSLEGIDILYPDGIDSVPLSLDDPSFAGGDPLLLIVDRDNTIGPPAGANLVAKVAPGFVEPVAGRYTRLTNSYPITDAIAGVSVSTDARARWGDSSGIVSSSDMRANGNVPLRANGRVHKLTTIIDDPDWTFLQGIRIEFQPAGTR